MWPVDELIIAAAGIQGALSPKQCRGGEAIALIAGKHDIAHWNCGYAVLRRAIDKSV
jgi:hypothetical protein